MPKKKSKPNSEGQDGKKGDKSAKDEVNNVSPDFGNTHVVGSESTMSYDNYVKMLEDKAHNILLSLNRMSTEQSKRVLNMVSERVDMYAIVDLKPIEP